MTVEAFFIPAPPGQRLALLYRPATTVTLRGALLQVAPFAEEMNKSRRMLALQARKLALAGFAVLQLDLLGCGDSSGDFGDTSWQAWQDDVTLGYRWLQANFAVPLWIWGLRCGCLLANETVSRFDTSVNLLYWQPVISGKQFLQQFLRLKVAAEMIGSEGKGVMERLRKDLQNGIPVEIAGYSLSPSLASGLETAELRPPAQVGCVEWFEISSRTDGALSPAAAICVKKWQDAGLSVRTQVLSGSAFWQTAEISECPELLEATLQALSEVRSR
ncbi:MAG TPA: hydrolase 2, exosortase A system-associated [Accumulibacter sp.]|nr:hydrolase 2, exosortase A system-associated [Accumulibacter sp.]